MSDKKSTFERDLAEVCWRELRVHLQRDALIMVAPELDLVATAVAVSADDKEQVGSWISCGQLTKPNAEQCQSWEACPDTSFRMLIVQPFILIQEPAHA